MTNFSKEYKRLNPEQKLAVDTIEGPVMVVAGPGTGKTQTLALRIANILLKTQIDPRNILCLTFTDNAAIEMLTRLRNFIGPDAYKVRIFTFHAFCGYLMSSNLEKFPQITEDNENVDESDRYEILLNILKTLSVKDLLRNINDEGSNLKDISEAISSLKKEGVSPERLGLIIEKEKEYLKNTRKYFTEFIVINARKITAIDQQNLYKNLLANADPTSIYTKGVAELIREYEGQSSTQFKKGIRKIFERLDRDSYFPKLESLKNIYEQYQEELRKSKQYDFEDMITFVLDRLTQDQDFLSSVQEEFQYILVDEYQDTNASQNEIIQLIGSFYDNPNLFVVGDDDQSIYRFQGANLENILQFSRNYKDSLKIITLKNNYRSQPYILQASRKIIEDAENRLEDEFPEVDKNLIPNRKAISKKIDLGIYKTREIEIADIASKIKLLLKEGTDPGEVAVILPKNTDMELFAEVFTREDIPFQVSRSGGVVNNIHIKNILILLEYLQNPYTEELLSRILYMPYFGFDNLDVFKIINFAYRKRLDIYKILITDTLLSESGVADIQVFQNFLKNISDWHREIVVMHPAQFFPFIIKEAKILEYLSKLEDNYLELNNFHILYDFLKKHLRANSKFNFEDLVRKVNLISECKLDVLNRTNILETSKVNILTAHKAKGLEFEHVFIPNLLSNQWEKSRGKSGLKLPQSINIHDYTTNEIDERIRLFFVALTRAKDKIYLSYPLLNGDGKENKPSMFISVITPDLIEEKKFDISQSDHREQLILSLSESVDTFSDKGKVFLNSLLENFALSPTSYNNYKKCPHCFFLTDIVRIPSAMSMSSVYGSVIHKTLNLFLGKFHRTKVLPSIQVLIDMYLTELKKQFLDPNQIRDLEEKGKVALEIFYNEKLSSVNPTSLTEIDFSRYKINIDGVPIKGRIDRIDFTDGVIDRVELVDYKTGVENSQNTSITNKGPYYVQLLFYKLLIENYPKYNWEVKSGKIVYVEPSKVGEPQKDKEMDLPDEDVNWLKAELKDTYTSIMNMEFSIKNEVNCHSKELHNIDFKF